MNSLTDLIQDFDVPEPISEGSAALTGQEHALTTHANNTLAVQLWGSLCFDLALRPDNYITILEDYNLSEEGLIQLLDNKAFVNRLKDAQLQIKTLGPTAGFVLAARTQAEKHISTVSNIISDAATPALVRVKAFSDLARFAHLDPATQKTTREGGEQRSSPGVLVQFNIGGGLLGKNKSTIDIQPIIEVDEQQLSN